ncbi:MAG: membrane dipeptidase [Gemmatimonadota bacterium]
MGKSKRASSYRSYAYLEPGVDYPLFELADEEARVARYELPLTEDEARRVAALAERCVMVSLHDHVGLFPSRIGETPEYMRAGRMFTAYRALSSSWWDAVFDNLMDGMGAIHSRVAWQWEDVVHDLGMRLADLAHQDLVVPALRVSDIRHAHDEGRVAWVAAMEGAAMIENDIDRLDILYGLGVRSLGIAYSESNALGGGLKESRDGGLTELGRRAVARMNRLGMLIDCAHCGDQTTLDTIAASEQPIVLSHIGARALWNTNRMAPDDVLEACAAKGGVIGIEAAPHTTITESHRRHGLESVMEHFEYVARLVGIEHVGFGPDTLYGDHVGLHGVYAGAFGLAQAHGSMDYEHVDWVEGLENPTEASHNILRWLVKHGYGDEDIERVLGGNALRVLDAVWT